MRKNNKKYFSHSFLCLVFFFSLSAFYGCQNNGATDHDNLQIDHVILDRRIGIIESLGDSVLSNKATHLLKLENGTIVFLTSSALNFNDPQYKDKTVEVSGILNYTNESKPIMVVENIDILEDKPSQQTKPVSWKDYSNTKLGFSLHYRDDFLMSEETSQIKLAKSVITDTSITGTQVITSTPSQHVIAIAVIKHSEDENLLQHLHINGNTSEDLSAARFTKSKIGADGIEALKKLNDDPQVVDFYFDQGTHFFHISFQGGNDHQSLEDQNIFYDILSSFRLLKGSSKSIDSIHISGEKPQGIPSDSEEKKSNTKPDTKTESTPAPTTKDPFDMSSFDNKVSVAPNNSLNIDVTQESLAGYSTFSSPSYKFDFQYPEKWYFSAGDTTDSQVIKHYDFGTKPLEDEPGEIGLDILTGSLPSGDVVNINDTSLVKIISGDTVEFYIKGRKSRLYKVTGPLNNETILATMASSIKD